MLLEAHYAHEGFATFWRKLEGLAEASNSL